jgi:hypothetical protein
MNIHVIDAIAFVLLMFLIGYGIWEITITNRTLRQMRQDANRFEKKLDEFILNQRIVIELLEKVISNQIK